jgi:K+ transporter
MAWPDGVEAAGAQRRPGGRAGVARGGGYAGLRLRLFAWMQRRSTQAAEFFRMPERRVVVLATQVEL